MGKTYRIILKQVGEIFILLGAVVFLPGLVAILYGEWHSAAGFGISFVIIAAIGGAILYFFKKEEEPEFDHALMVVASGYLGIACLGAIPFFLIAWLTPMDVLNSYIPDGSGYARSSMLSFREPLNCFFESMSGFTTSGLTMTDHAPSLGKSVLFYRSLSQWIGGGGFILMTLITFKGSSNRSLTLLFISESSGETLRRHTIDTAKLIWKLYVFLTLFVAIYLGIGTWILMPSMSAENIIFNSFNHALTGQSTGGFTVLDGGLRAYNSNQMEILHILPMIMGALSISFYFRIFYKKKYRDFYRDKQTLVLLISLVIGSFILSLLLFQAGRTDDSIHHGIFQFVSGMTGTGWQTAEIARWDYISVLFLLAGMFIGGSAGGTSGGIKVIRLVDIFRELRWQINKVFLSGQTIKEIQHEGGAEQPGEKRGEFVKAATLAILFFLLIFTSSIVTHLFTRGEYSYSTALFEAASAQGTVGLSTGLTSPSMPAGLKLIYIFQMWTGRLEIIPVIAFIRVLLLGSKPRVIKW